MWMALLLGSVIWAEEQYFRQANATTWDEARLYCQACFKDLTTLTSRNVHDLAQNLISDFWVGLRRSLNGSIPWSRWSNGDTVTYQNWYPGHPVPKVETCPLTPNNTSMNSTTAPKMNNIEEQCPLVMEILTCLNLTYGELENITRPLVNPTPHTLYTTPVPTVNVTSNKTQTCDTKAEKYIEDSCVALLSFGMWKEKQCNESLPFICYDERFLGEIKISNVSKSEGYVDWSPGPGNISHYRVKVTGDNASLIYNETDLFKQLVNLTAGTRYNVQVYPVKCGRDLNPQNISFYTPPSDVYDLNVKNVTTTSVELSWNHSGNCDFYLIKGADKPNKINKTKTEICKLTPGTEYTFTVSAVVNETTESVSAKVSTFTKPSRVRDLMSADDGRTVITVHWNASEGIHSSYRICLNETSACISCSQCENCNQLGNCHYTTVENFTFTDKTPGKKYCLCVAALTDNNTLSGEMVTIEAYTRPENVELGNLEPSDQSIFAEWTINGAYKEFRVSIEEEGLENKNYSTTDKNYSFEGLKAGVYYTVTVTTLSEKPGLESESVKKSDYTTPTPPPWANATVLNETSITLTWGVPKKSEGASNIKYNVTCYSVYWNFSTPVYQTKENHWTFGSLNSGTHYNFTVSVVAGNSTSHPTSVSNKTKPNRKTLTFAMLCTSKTTLLCSNSKAQTETLNKLERYFSENLIGIHWNLTIVDRK
ncbi:putative receptor-type tyrosine-protein phosphatase eta-like [Triplophysa rosa]|uniref:Receptor-type tyrosine-protein phosphatase eta-like n=2 Tax=Triplophysa rosa TaxID=992332 RepID=A0A9W8CBB3_TRIRA|nr:putative receptor-type tyrosine-protein phosphatase eta-like [Triplophysa rosa]